MSIATEMLDYFKLRTGVRDVLLETRKSVFSPLWVSFVSSVSSVLSNKVDKRVANAYDSLKYRFPPVAVVPGSNYYVVYVKKADKEEDVFLGLSMAFASKSSGTFFCVVPYLKEKDVLVLVKKGINPAVLAEFLFTTPIISSIPCSDVLDSLKVVKERLMLASYSYILKDDLSHNILGYVLLKLLKWGRTEYRHAFSKVLEFVLEVLKELEVDVKSIKNEFTYYGVKVAIVVVFLS